MALAYLDETGTTGSPAKRGGLQRYSAQKLARVKVVKQHRPVGVAARGCLIAQDIYSVLLCSHMQIANGSFDAPKEPKKHKQFL